MIIIFLRTIIIYLILICVMRFMGKRQIGELQISELVTALMLSELAVMPITNNNIPITHAIVPISTLITLEIILTFVVTKSAFLKKIFDGTPSIIIKNGKLDQKELLKLRLSMEEFIGELRLKNISDIKDVEYALLEQNGRLSVFPKVMAKTPTVEDFGFNSEEKGISHAIIVDGYVSKNNLNIIGQNEAWLQKRISKYECVKDDIFLFSVDDAGNEYLIKKDKNKKTNEKEGK